MLRRLPATDDPRVLVGSATGDDAGVYRLRPDLALVQTWLDHPVHGEQALATARALEAERVAR